MDLPPTPPTLTDGHVTLRAHSPDDAQGSYEATLDPDYQRWTSVPLPVSLEGARHFVGTLMPGAWADGSSWGFAVEHDGSYVGSVELRPDDREAGVAEVAFGSHPRVRGLRIEGRSVMERALRLLLTWGFDEAGVRTVMWRAHRGNWASRRLAWKVGFRVEGTVRRWTTQRGERHDAWIGTLLHDDSRQPPTTWLTAPRLQGEQVVLRPFTDADVPRIVEACDDERTRHWLGRLPEPYDEDAARDYLLHVGEQQADGRGVWWAVTDPATDELLGSMALFGVDPGREAEVGYWAHPAARGRGVTTEATGLALRFAFGMLGVQRVVAFAAVDNAASRRVLEANGLTQYATERLGARIRTGPADQARLDVLAEEWLAGQVARMRAGGPQA